MNITKGKIARAQKIVFYGPEGIGKSTFASQFPEPLFIDTEGSTDNMDVARMDKPTSWTMMLQQIGWVKQNHPCKTLVIDTIDWAERMAIEHICQMAQKNSIEDFGYGVGYIKLEEELGKFLNLLQELVDVGINVVLTAHAQIRNFNQPDEMGSYDRYELKLGKKTSARTSALVKEWADMVLFANYKVFAVEDTNGKKKAQGGQRVIYTTHRPAWDAKNRFGLPDEIPLDYNQIAHIFQAPATPQPQPVETTQQPQTPIQSAVNQIVGAQQTEKGVEATQEELFNANTPPLPKTDQNFERPPVTDDLTGIHPALVDLMKLHNVQPIEIQQAVSSKGYYPIDTPIVNYDEGFIQGVLVGAWDQVFQMIQDLREKQAF